MTKEKQFDRQDYLNVRLSIKDGDYIPNSFEKFMIQMIDSFDSQIDNWNYSVNKLTYELEAEKEKSEFAKAICFALVGKKTEQ